MPKGPQSTRVMQSFLGSDFKNGKTSTPAKNGSGSGSVVSMVLLKNGQMVPMRRKEMLRMFKGKG